MNRKVALNRAIADALNQVLIPELVRLVCKYAPVPDAVFVFGGVPKRFTVPHPTGEHISFAGADTNPPPDERVKRVVFVDRSLNAPVPLYGACATAIGDRIYVCGGLDSQINATACVSSIDPFEGGLASGWLKSPELPQPVCRGAVVAVNGFLYVFGGGNYHVVETPHVWKFDASFAGATTAGNGWTLLTARMTSAKGSCDACVAADGRTIFVSGCRNEESTAIDVFDVETETFKSTLPPPAATHGGAMCYYRDSLWLIGGYGHSGTEVAHVYRWPNPLAPPATGAPPRDWVADAELQIARSHCAAVVVDDAMFVIAGRAEVQFVQCGIRSIESYDAANRCWVLQKASLSASRFDFAFAHCQT